MKKFGQRLVLFVVAATVFFTGAGVTIMNYCCASCSGQTLFMTEQHVCCARTIEVEESPDCCSHKKAAHHDTCETSFANDTHCTASRLSIDIDPSSFRPHVSTPFVWTSNVALALASSILPEKGKYTDKWPHCESPPEIPPREYLSLIRTLVI
ncbi:MAG: hypothetical protein LBR26_12520 [Prevotella sp.]|jgi:hypothetical protein|nr:hypothetical protein [Prevotella sp.]